MGRHDLAGLLECDLREKPHVTADQPTGPQGSGKAHVGAI